MRKTSKPSPRSGVNFTNVKDPKDILENLGRKLKIKIHDDINKKEIKLFKRPSIRDKTNKKRPKVKISKINVDLEDSISISIDMKS